MSKNNELRKNPISGSVVIIAPDRQKPREHLVRIKPRDWSKLKPGVEDGSACCFCEDHEDRTPPEVKSYRKEGTEADKKGWWVRTVPNLMPAVDSSIPSELLLEEQRGPFLVTPAFGHHYLIVETPDHRACLATVPKDQVREVLSMWRDLTFSVGSDRNIRYVFLFENYGPLAGASQCHSHSQLIALPMIPTRIMNELRGARDYYGDNNQCFYCREIEWELRMGERLVAATDNFVAWCPFTARTPYQVVISPKEHQSYFANISTHPLGKDNLTEFAGLLQNVLIRIRKTLNDPDYSLYFHTAPTNQPEMAIYHWHCQIEPLTEAIVAGFEKGSGIYINPRSPENAAADLREALPDQSTRDGYLVLIPEEQKKSP